MDRWVKKSTFNALDTGDACSVPGLGRSPEGGHGNPLQYACLDTSEGTEHAHIIRNTYFLLCFKSFDISVSGPWLMVLVLLYFPVLEGLQYFTRLQIGDGDRVQVRMLYNWVILSKGRLAWWLSGKESACKAWAAGDMGVIPQYENPLEESLTTHSSILTWSIPWTKEPGRLPSTGSQRVGHDWSDLAHTHTFNDWYQKVSEKAKACWRSPIWDAEWEQFDRGEDNARLPGLEGEGNTENSSSLLRDVPV